MSLHDARLPSLRDQLREDAEAEIKARAEELAEKEIAKDEKVAQKIKKLKK